MPITVANIAFGPGTLFTGATLPGPGLQPTFTAGVPAGGTDVGATLSAMFTIKPELEPIMVEQSLIPVDAHAKRIEISLEVEIAEMNLDRLLEHLAAGATLAGTSPNQFIQGGQVATPTFLTGVTLVQRDRVNPTRVSYVMLYRSVCPDGVQIAYAREKITSYKVRFLALADLARAVGDQFYSLDPSAVTA